jgi:hypothetical protein
MMPRVTWNTHRWAVVAAVCFALGAVGCGQQAGGPEGSSASHSPAPRPTAVIESPGDPSAQKLSVDPSSGYWRPDVVYAAAGKPIDITFGKGTYECADGLTFAAFGVRTAVDLTHGPVMLHSSGLPPGTYPWLCSMGGMCGGRLIVR